MAKMQRFHLFRREEQDIGEQYTHRVLVLSADWNEIELNTKDAETLFYVIDEAKIVPDDIFDVIERAFSTEEIEEMNNGSR